MNLKRVIAQAADGHGHDHGCEACLNKYHPGGRSADLVMLYRIAAAGVLFLGGILLRAALPAAAAVLEILSALCAGYDTCFALCGGIILRHRVNETLSVLSAVLLLFVSGHCAVGAGLMLGYRVCAQLRVLIFVRKRMTEPVDSTPTLSQTVINIVLPAAAILIALAYGIPTGKTVSGILELAAALCIVFSPCAAAVSLPLGRSVGKAAAARQNIRLTDETVLPGLARAKTVVIDKTGVLDSSGFCVIGAESERLGKDVLMRIAAHASALSQQTYAEAIRSAYAGTIYIDLIQSFQEEEAGIAVSVDNVPILLGLAEYLQAQGVDLGGAVTADPSMYLAINREYAGRIRFGDKPHPDAAKAIADLKRSGLAVAMFTDSSQTVSRAFADMVGISSCYARPISKSALLRDIRERDKNRLPVFVTRAGYNTDCLKDTDLSLVYSSDAIAQGSAVIAFSSPVSIPALMRLAGRVRLAAWGNILLSAASSLWLLWLVLFGGAPLWLTAAVWTAVCLLCIGNSALCGRALYRSKKHLKETS